MNILLVAGVFFAVVSIALFILEYFLAMKFSKLAAILPMIVFGNIIYFGMYCAFVSFIMFAIYFIVKYSNRKMASSFRSR
ncbi:MAG: hypothetical protein ACLSV2_11585 [Clostridium sp.]